ncbi:MAG: hypothetical protein OQK72_08945 [Gammaproteobacteria bacterium]|nr:hypothetical protein [Gammaproteobacteria bacterium]MCW9056891.1 hypothetical protein [Gammaproteobacteria bacterium]
MSENRARKLHRIFQLNIIAGVLIFAISCFFMITGEYESLAMRQQAENMLNLLGLGSMLYAVGFWYLTMFASPLKRISR